MTAFPAHKFLRFIAALGFVLQVAGPGALSAAGGDRLDLRAFMCMPAGKLSPEGLAAAREMARLLLEERGAPEAADAHCSLCLAAEAAPVSKPESASAPWRRTTAFSAAPKDFSPAKPAAGPPLGERAPPSPHIA